jgi:hypothetical protein
MSVEPMTGIEPRSGRVNSAKGIPSSVVGYAFAAYGRITLSVYLFRCCDNAVDADRSCATLMQHIM